jgi:hypothetical protein
MNRESGMRRPGEIALIRGMYEGKPWFVQTTIVVRDAPEQTVLLLEPGAECAAPWGYLHGKHGGRERWDRWHDMAVGAWRIEKYGWHTNRFLILLEPRKFHAIYYIWNRASGAFQCCYINFQLPFTRTPLGLETLDLELDIVVSPDGSWKWKDEDDYKAGIAKGILKPEWVQGIEDDKKDVFARIEKRLPPLDGSWLDWKPDPAWTAPRLPEGWDGA